MAGADPPFSDSFDLLLQRCLSLSKSFPEQFILMRMQRHNFSIVELRVAITVGFWKGGRVHFYFFARLLHTLLNESPFLNCWMRCWMEHSQTVKQSSHKQLQYNGFSIIQTRLSVSGHLDVGSRCHIFGPSGKNMLLSRSFATGESQAAV